MRISTKARLLTGGSSGLLLAAILVYALNLRGPIVALAPAIEMITEGLQISTGTAGLLAGIPVFCFALAVPFASLLIRKAGLEGAVAISLLGVLIGTIVRSSDGVAAAFIGMAIIGVAITIGNVAVPVIIGRDFPHAVSSVSGLYTAALNMGSVITTLGTAPLAEVVGWRWAIAGWGVLAVAGLALWRVATAKKLSGEQLVPSGNAPILDESSHTSVWKRWDAWLLALTFGAQSFSYYALTAWMPTLLADKQGFSAASAGGFSAVFQLFGIAGALGVPLIVRRGVPLKFVSVLMSIMWLTLPLGLLAAPELFLVWMCIGGVAQGGNFTVFITLIVQRSRSQTESRRMSAMVQGIGYTLAALGPYALGAVFAVSNSWDTALLVTCVTLGSMAITGFIVTSAGPYKQRRTFEV